MRMPMISRRPGRLRLNQGMLHRTARTMRDPLPVARGTTSYQGGSCGAVNPTDFRNLTMVPAADTATRICCSKVNVSSDCRSLATQLTRHHLLELTGVWTRVGQPELHGGRHLWAVRMYRVHRTVPGVHRRLLAAA
jgi:hypothetical protein